LPVASPLIPFGCVMKTGKIPTHLERDESGGFFNNEKCVVKVLNREVVSQVIRESEQRFCAVMRRKAFVFASLWWLDKVYCDKIFSFCRWIELVVASTPKKWVSESVGGWWTWKRFHATTNWDFFLHSFGILITRVDT
jgi:hypothetical protein